MASKESEYRMALVRLPTARGKQDQPDEESYVLWKEIGECSMYVAGCNEQCLETFFVVKEMIAWQGSSTSSTAGHKLCAYK